MRHLLRDVRCWAIALFACVGCAPRTASAPAAATSADITEADLRHRLFLIADDSMMGRQPGERGNYQTAAYVAAEFQRLGLEPAGDNRTYFQTVPMWRSVPSPANTLTVDGTTLTAWRDFAPPLNFGITMPASGADAVYGGILSDSASWIAPDRARGRIVVIAVPSGPLVVTRALGDRMRGAVGVAIAGMDSIPSILRDRPARPVIDTLGVAPVLVTNAAARALLGADPNAMTPGALGRHVTGGFGTRWQPVEFPARNVVAVLRGSDSALRGEYVALTAHNDHVGFNRQPVEHDSLRAFNTVMRPMGVDSRLAAAPTAEQWTHIRTIIDSLRKLRAPRQDSIFNGADDDGSGTVSILEIAEKMARSRARPRRSVLFVNHTGEEMGLVGSAWFTDHATVPLDSVVAEIDQDMVGRGTATDMPRGRGTLPGSPRYLEVVGAKRLSRRFGEMLESANARQPVPFEFDYTYDAPGHPLQYYCRADHYNYARYGIPSVAFSRGEHMDYHQVTDEAQYISYVDLARVSRMVYDAAMDVANAPERPPLDQPKQADPHARCRQ